MRYLLDINVLLALLHDRHPHFQRARAWFSGLEADTVICLCSIVELGFLRISVQTSLQESIFSAQRTLALLKRVSMIQFEFLPDELGAGQLPSFVQKPASITDGHLLELAHRHRARLATFDTGIPGSYLLP
jgi:predicted nucleic acid-binding protein